MPCTSGIFEYKYGSARSISHAVRRDGAISFFFCVRRSVCEAVRKAKIHRIYGQGDTFELRDPASLLLGLLQTEGIAAQSKYLFEVVSTFQSWNRHHASGLYIIILYPGNVTVANAQPCVETRKCKCRAVTLCMHTHTYMRYAESN